MFLLGILAIFQMLLLPGLVFVSLYKPNGSFFYKTSVTVAISMLFNATVNYFLSLLNIYVRSVIFGLIIIEVLLLVWVNRKSLKSTMDDLFTKIRAYFSNISQKIIDLFRTDLNSSTLVVIRSGIIVIFAGFAFSLVFWFLKRLTNNIGTVFNTWDAVMSWNTWAITWARGLMPNVQLTYPQLLPLNLSLTYLLMDNYQVVLFAKAIMPIFALLTVLTVFELAIEEKKYGYFLAVILVYFLYKNFLGEYIADGYADIPVAFMALTALVPYLRNGTLSTNRKDYVLSILIAAAAGLTKQVGLFVLILLPIFVILSEKGIDKKTVGKLFAWCGVGILLVLPWYLPIGLQVVNDFAKSGFAHYISHSTQVQGSSSPFVRIFEAITGLGKYAILYLFLIPTWFLLNKKQKLLSGLFVIPFTILWAIVASYSERNLSITFVFVAILCGIAIENMMEWLFSLFEKIKFGRLLGLSLIVLLIVPLGYFAWKNSDEKLINLWKTEQSQIFSPEINNAIYGMDRSDPSCKKIITNYPVRFLPGLEDMQTNSYFDDYEFYETLTKKAEICWILVPNYSNKQITDEIDNKLASGEYQLLFSSDNWVPYRLIKIK